MIRAKNGFNRRHELLPWVICFDVTMPQEVFTLLHEWVISYGLDVLGLAWFSTITFTNMRRMCTLFNKFEDCKGFAKELGARKGVVKLIVDDSKNGIIKYNLDRKS